MLYSQIITKCSVQSSAVEEYFICIISQHKCPRFGIFANSEKPPSVSIFLLNQWSINARKICSTLCFNSPFQFPIAMPLLTEASMLQNPVYSNWLINVKHTGLSRKVFLSTSYAFCIWYMILLTVWVIEEYYQPLLKYLLGCEESFLVQ